MKIKNASYYTDKFNKRRFRLQAVISEHLMMKLDKCATDREMSRSALLSELIEKM